MPVQLGNEFTLELPRQYSDESTYVLALEPRGGFRPSVVVKTEQPPAPVDLAVYAAEQRGKIREAFDDVVVLSVDPVVHGELAAEEWVYEWGPAAGRVRQVQRFVLLACGSRVVTLTGTALAESFDELATGFSATFSSYRSRIPGCV